MMISMFPLSPILLSTNLHFEQTFKRWLLENISLTRGFFHLQLQVMLGQHWFSFSDTNKEMLNQWCLPRVSHMFCCYYHCISSCCTISASLVHKLDGKPCRFFSYKTSISLQIILHAWVYNIGLWRCQSGLGRCSLSQLSVVFGPFAVNILRAEKAKQGGEACKKKAKGHYCRLHELSNARLPAAWDYAVPA